LSKNDVQSRSNVQKKGKLFLWEKKEGGVQLFSCGGKGPLDPCGWTGALLKRGKSCSNEKGRKICPFSKKETIPNLGSLIDLGGRGNPYYSREGKVPRFVWTKGKKTSTGENHLKKKEERGGEISKRWLPSPKKNRYPLRGGKGKSPLLKEKRKGARNKGTCQFFGKKIRQGRKKSMDSKKGSRF